MANFFAGYGRDAVSDVELEFLEAGTIPAKLALRLRRELENIEMEACKEGTNQQSEEAKTYTWLIMVAKVLKDELEKEGRKHPMELERYLT